MAKVRVAINGFGRIGRNVFRAIYGRDDIEVVAINGLAEAEAMAYLGKYDSTQGIFPGEFKALDNNTLSLDGRIIPVTHFRNPAEIEWPNEPEVVLESTGKFRRRTGEQGGYGDHLRGSVKKVVLSAPSRDAIDRMIVMGVNEHDLRPEDDCVSNASCTTNCLAPVAKVLHESFGIELGYMTTVHSYTNDQRILDSSHKDLRRARAAAVSQIPTTTGAAKAMGTIMPELAGLLDGISIRVPTPTGSLVDFVCTLKKEVSAEEINAAMKAAAEGELKGILRYTEDPLVSADIVHDPHSSIFDALSTKVNGRMVKVLSWYDNEWGYSCRTADLCKRVIEIDR
ncbi:MAG: type I glyceraldehyde-3-phosphate dehydrogenase [Bacteroidetes bacterium]|nr:MAG: type I glyceraldehyde-3-phosphate dehydrogenase [Bacteroidota bacterium]